MVKVNYTKLWIRIIDDDMGKSKLRKASGMTTNTMVKLGKNKNVSTDVLCKICDALCVETRT